MKKNYLYIIVIVSFIFSSCGKTYYNITLTKALNNRTNKDLYYEVETQLGYNGIYIEQMSMNSIVLYKEGYYIDPMYKYKPKIEVYRESIYNLTDTTKFEHWKYDTSISEAGRMFLNILFYVNGRTNNTCIKVTDDFLQLLPKDYSMLEKFPEYYKK